MTTEDMLVKHADEETQKFGVNPSERSLPELLEKGCLIIDKSAGPTSHDVVDAVKQILRVRKAGHSGTLDPQVTGVLLVGLGKATRLMEYMLESNKEYVALLYLHEPVDEQVIKDTFQAFTGPIKQLPPVVSAVKRQERLREIYYQDILEIREDQYVLFRVGCQHGTYIRKLCSDMAEHMGVSGQMKELRRTKAGPLTEDDGAISLDTLRNLWELHQEADEERLPPIESELRCYLRPMEDLLQDFRKVYARDSAVDSLSYGSDLAIPGVARLDSGISMGETVAVMTLRGELIAMGIAYLSSDQVMKKQKGAFIKTNKVFMSPGTYPQYWEFTKEEE